MHARKKPLSEVNWHTAKGVSWNDLGYVLELYITKDETTEDYFRRFTSLKINNQP